MGKASRSKHERREAAERSAAEGRRRGCLFCRSKRGDFRSKEHIFPESLGNREHVLPAGVVCDRCNHEALAPLDKAFCDFTPIAMMRTMNGVPSKSGKPPIFKFDNGVLSCDASGALSLQLDSRKWHDEDVPAPPGRHGWSFTAQRHDLSPKRLALVHRALIKMALEYAWLNLGEERALSADFDKERQIVLDGGHHGYIVIPKKSTPTALMNFWYRANPGRHDQRPWITIMASFWGVMLGTDSRFPKPPTAVPDELALVCEF